MERFGKLMKKLLTIVMAAVLLFGLVSCANKDAGTDADKDSGDTSKTDEAGYTLLNDGVLTIGSEIGYPPYEMYAEDNVTPIGYDIDLANELGRRLGLDINFINTSFDIIAENLGANYDVIISGYTINEKRLEQMLFSDPYIDNYQAIVVRADSDWTADSLTDIDGHSIAFQKGTTTDEIVDDLIATGSVKCTPSPNEKILTCFQQLSNGEVDMVVCDSTVADVHLASNSDAYKVIYVDQTSPEQFGIGIPKSNPELQKAINEILADLKEEGFFDELNATWFGSNSED
jgi:ABC-type amino acid transport substrate-binding protein